MKKTALLLVIFLTGTAIAFSQKEGKEQKLSDTESRKLLSQLHIDSSTLLSESARMACKCIDSITVSQKDHKEISTDIAECIDEQVGAYQLSLKLMETLKGGSNRVELNTNKESDEYKKYYYQLERWLKDSCASMNKAVTSNNSESELSMSRDPKARAEYNKGIDRMEGNDLEKAVNHFQKAVSHDPRFVFAWDNLGVTLRKLGRYDEALEAYQKSLELDPKGVTPLHNIPVVYEYQKKFDKALEAYNGISGVYPDDPEAYYGAGRIYTYFLVDLEKGLDKMCKAYNAYIEIKSPYRVDAEKNINYIYGKMKAEGKEARFYEILKENHLDPEK